MAQVVSNPWVLKVMESRCQLEWAVSCPTLSTPSQYFPQLPQLCDSCLRLTGSHTSAQGSHRGGSKTKLSSLKIFFLWQAVCGNKGIQRLVSSVRSPGCQHLSPQAEEQDGNTSIYSVQLFPRRLDLFHRPERCLFPYSSPPDFLEVHLEGQSLPVSFSSLWSVPLSLCVYQDSQRDGVNTQVLRFMYQIYCYLDNWLILEQSWAQCLIHSGAVVSLALELGFLIDQEKSCSSHFSPLCIWVWSSTLRT